MERITIREALSRIEEQIAFWSDVIELAAAYEAVTGRAFPGPVSWRRVDAAMYRWYVQHDFITGDPWHG